MNIHLSPTESWFLLASLIAILVALSVALLVGGDE